MSDILHRRTAFIQTESSLSYYASQAWPNERRMLKNIDVSSNLTLLSTYRRMLRSKKSPIIVTIRLFYLDLLSHNRS